MLALVRSIAALEAEGKDSPPSDQRLARVQLQLAVIRTLADRAELLARRGEAEEIGERLIEEMARLGCHLLEAAAELAESARAGDTGAFARPR